MAMGDELQTIFSAFDEENKGFISTERFMLLAEDYFGTADREDVKSILEALDPAKSGFINYPAFCQGVKTILSESKEKAKGKLDQLVQLPLLNEESHSSRIASDDDTHSNGTSESTFNEYDDSQLTDQSEESFPSILINEVFLSTIQSNEGTRSLPRKKRVAMNGVITDNIPINGQIVHDPTDSGHHSPLFKNGEEQFEDFGENDAGIEIEIEDAADTVQDSEETNAEHHHYQLSPGISSSLPSHSSGKPFMLKRDVWSHAQLDSGPTRRLTSKEFANQLYRSSSSHNLPMGAAEEAYGEYAASDSDVLELNDRVRELETQVTFLEQDRSSTETFQDKLKRENILLHKRKEQLEDQLKELDQRQDEIVKTEQAKHKEIMVKMEKEHREEMEALHNRLATLQLERKKFDHDVAQLRSQVTALTQQNETIESQLREADNTWLALSVEFQTKEEEHLLEKEEMEDIIHNNNTIIDKLSRQLEEMQSHHRVELDHRDALMRSPSIADLPSRFTELRLEVQQLKKENQQLKESNDELSVQLINNSVKIGKSLLHKGVCRTDSMAAELEHSSKDEVMQALQEERQLNLNLRNYIGKILERVIEKNPGILEIDSRHGSFSSTTSSATS